MKKLILALLSFAIGACIFFFVIHSIGWEKIIGSFRFFSFGECLIILFLTFLITIISIWRWKEILKGGGVNVSFKTLSVSYLAGFSMMFLFPIIIWGGEFLRAYIFKKQSSISWSKGMASIIIERILEWTLNLTIIFWGLVFIFYNVGFSLVNFWFTFGLAFLLFTAIICFLYFKIFKEESVVKVFLRNKGNEPLEIEKEIFCFFKKERALAWKCFGLSSLKAFVMYLRVWILMGFLGKGVGVLSSFLIFSLTYLAAIIPIPASLGSHEAIQIATFNGLGLGASVAAVFTMIIRGADLVPALIGMAILLKLGMGIFKESKKVNL
ncbi:MAG: hypothetical protein COX37_01205 [Candidatus Nealsonbacteria bacterium CG23_combo_of_CG06-09_8_20_14_all_39_17]|uniref:Flippase-like domain-containing protein n=1 Tax=Candidatus Nealsonbacteria bacterium CG23_combo_of_CG06-09_8_20_14_all_39_17 TaxID=1974722 RepID=A0A2G9YUP0_9BACT|nr:MAG: hypothetical protein COX37_01205 [Candidatus Nealsonbacteria bacterium CG23_combo_of_CG06-09_8_20_14_all_39_17]PIU43793.1 MAG: hypothetical protein COS96_02445 [Candidatus Nealsonbacteria bacterium CG07_land_8_20_14_0_80_39_13]